MKVAITGPDGLLGTELVRECLTSGASVAPLLEAEVDITDAAAVRKCIGRVSPELVIHTAAFTAVDDAEGEADRAYAVNAYGTFHVCRAAALVGARVIYISTDYVFDGGAERPYRPDDEPKPLQVYGRSKLAGELYVRQNTPGGLIVRTGSLYGPGGAGFPDKLCGRAADGDPLKVVNDQWCSPTLTNDLAKAILALADKVASGVYHLTNPGSVTWYSYALRLVEGLGLPNEVEPVSAEGFSAPAVRPRRAELDCSAAAEEGVVMRPWTEALADYLARCGGRLRRSAGLDEESPST
ncbi:dTDP-4-dehydrorhamnose reductase [bacterium]|nr:dTDP-4-dehydrorhamnose reductase [bacterium]